MKIKYEIFDFVKGTVEVREREIDLEDALKNNAFLQMLSKKNGSKPKRPLLA